MSLSKRLLGTAPAIVPVFALGLALAMGCANAKQGTATPDATPVQQADAPGPTADASCGDACDADGDGVPDKSDMCPDTPSGAPVNHVGCADSQLMATLNPAFPPYGLTFTPTGDPGRAGGLTWLYTAMQRGDLFHIYWLVCDDPATPCGLSLDGPIDDAAEKWTLSITDTDLPNGKLVFTNTTHIALADTSLPQLNGRLTVSIFDSSEAPISFSNIAVLGVTARAATYGAEIKGSAFKVTVLSEVQDPNTGVWTPDLDYYDAAATPDTGGTATQSFDGEFYDK